jgi:hypothetical protein
MGLMAAMALATAGRANATVLFDTFGPGDSYGASPYSVGAWFDSPFLQCAAFTITPSESYRLDTIEVAISRAVSWPGGPISANELTGRLIIAEPHFFFPILQVENLLLRIYPLNGDLHFLSLRGLRRLLNRCGFETIAQRRAAWLACYTLAQKLDRS